LISTQSTNPLILTTDDDVNFWGDMLYARGILDEIVEDCRMLGERIRPLPSIMSSSLDLALELVRDAFPDDAGVALQEWRNSAQAVAA
jgi:hypothetical protein